MIFLRSGNIRSAHLLEKTCFLICRHFQWQLGFTFGRLLKFPGQDEAGAENNKVTLNYRLFRELPAWKQKPTRRMQSLENQNDCSTSCHSLHDLRIVEYRQIYAYHKKSLLYSPTLNQLQNPYNFQIKPDSRSALAILISIPGKSKNQR